MKYYAVCLITMSITYLGEFDDVDDATGANYRLDTMYRTIPVSENGLRKLYENIDEILPL